MPKQLPSVTANELTAFNIAVSNAAHLRRDLMEVFDPTIAAVLEDRVADIEGVWIIWDPEDGSEGFLLRGDDLEKLAQETLEHFSINLKV